MIKKKIDILLVEDNEGDVELIQRAFRDDYSTCNIFVVHDGVDALDFLNKRNHYDKAPTPQLILLDLNMPRMDGKELLKSVKMDSKLKMIPVVVLTSSESPADIRECYEHFSNCYVVKPFQSKQFTYIVREVVNFWSTVAQLPQ